MLKGIPAILSPELLKVLCEMGHGDRIVIADGNFPIGLVGKDPIIIRADGHNIPDILDAILQVFPLDTYAEKPVTLMNLLPGDTVTFYGEGAGNVTVTDTQYNTHSAPGINAAFVVLNEEDAS